MKKILIACEWSGEVRDAFRRRGFDAWSCDLEEVEPEGEFNNYHLFGDVRWFLNRPGYKWDMMIAFPPCTHLAVSGARYFVKKKAEQKGSIEFFMSLATNRIARIAIENPIGVMSTFWRKPDQIIQPFQFGHPESKKTCLWLKGLPKLVPTKLLPLPKAGYWSNQTPSGQNKLGPSPTRAKERGRTYRGVAEAMAEQWGEVLK